MILNVTLLFATIFSTSGTSPTLPIDGASSTLPSSLEDTDESPLHLTFGVYRTDKATTMYRQFVPIIEAIQDRLEQRLNRPVDIELRIHKTYEEGLDSLVNGDTDFVRFGPASYVLAKQRNGGIELLAMELKDGKKRFPGVIVVRKESEIRRLSDLRGRTFAFGDKNSTIGRYLAQAELVAAGVRGRDLHHYAFLGRHDAVAAAVILGDYDAGSLKENTLRKVNDGDQLRVLHRFENVTKPWIARAEMDARVRTGLRRTLLELDDETALEALSVDGWVECSDEEYEPVRQAMRTATKQFQ